MKAEAAQKQLTGLMSKHADFGASDSEGWQAMRQIEYAAEEGQRFPFVPRSTDDPLSRVLNFNPFQLYDSIPGWETASQELVAAAEVYWRALVEEKLGVRTDDDRYREVIEAIATALDVGRTRFGKVDIHPAKQAPIAQLAIRYNIGGSEDICDQIRKVCLAVLAE